MFKAKTNPMSHPMNDQPKCVLKNLPSRIHAKQRRGSMTVLGAFSMVILLAFAVILIDIAWMSVIQTEAQVASDVAARGALTAFINDKSKDSFKVRRDFFDQQKMG